MLTDPACRNAKPKEKQYKLSDEKGLFLLIHPNGSKYWRLKYRVAGKEKMLALGVYPEVSLAAARSKRDDARKLNDNGVDPGALKKEEKRTRKIAAENSFEAITKEWLAHIKDKWSEDHHTYTEAQQRGFATVITHYPAKVPRAA